MGNFISYFLTCVIRPLICLPSPTGGCDEPALCSSNMTTVFRVRRMNRNRRLILEEEGDIACNSYIRAVRLIADTRSADNATFRAVFRCVTPPPEQEELQVHSTITTMTEDYPTNNDVLGVPVLLMQIEADNNSMCHVKNGIVVCDGLLVAPLDVTVCCPNPSSGLLLQISGYSNADSSGGTGDIAPFTLDFGVTISNDSKNVLFRDSQSRQLIANPMEVNCRQPTDYPFDYTCTSVFSDDDTAMATTDTLYFQF